MVANVQTVAIKITVNIKENKIMKLKRIIAQQIWQIRQELDIPGSDTHDWWLAEEFLQSNPDRIDDDDVYVWFIELDENMVPRDKTLDNYPE